MTDLKAPTRVWYIEDDKGNAVSTVLGHGTILPRGVYETCLLFADDSCEIVCTTTDREEAAKCHATCAASILGRLSA